MIKISKIETSDIDPEILAFAPVECMDCNFDGIIAADYFLVTPGVETESEHMELERIVKEQLGYNRFTEVSCNLGQLIFVTRCPHCGSEDIFVDF